MLIQSDKLKIEANAQAGYIACTTSIPVAIKINKFAAAILDQHNTLVKNSQSVIDVTPLDDPQYKTKVANLNKLKKDGPNIAAVHFPVTTKKECKAKEKAALLAAGPHKSKKPHGPVAN